MPYKPMPKSEMVDRIAKAMWDDTRLYPARTPYDDTHDWDDLWKESQKPIRGEADFEALAIASSVIGSLRGRARIAIDTLREPSMEMIEAGVAALRGGYEPLYEDSEDFVLDIWRAMLEAAYKRE